MESVIRDMAFQSLYAACGKSLPSDLGSLKEALLRWERKRFLFVAGPDSDGFNVEHGIANWMTPLMYHVTVTRQVACHSAGGPSGGTELLQVDLEYLYRPEEGSGLPGSGIGWWFREESGSTGFAEWVEMVVSDPVWRALDIACADSSHVRAGWV